MAAAALGQQHNHNAASQDTGPAPLLNGLGKLHHPITTVESAGAALFRPGPHAGVRVQSRRSRAFVRATSRSSIRSAPWLIGASRWLAGRITTNRKSMQAARKSLRKRLRKREALSPGASAAEQSYIHAMALRVSMPIRKPIRKNLGARLPRCHARTDEALSKRHGRRRSIRRCCHGSARLDALEDETASPNRALWRRSKRWSRY